MARGREHVPDAHIHPGHLVKPLAYKQQPVLVHADSMGSALLATADNLFHNRPDFFQKCSVFCTADIQIRRMDIQKRCIRCIILRLIVPFREQIRHQAVFAVCRKRTQDAFGSFRLPRRNAAARKRYHRIASPVLKKRKTRQNRHAACGGPLCRKLAGAFGKHLRSILLQAAGTRQLRPVRNRICDYLICGFPDSGHSVHNFKHSPAVPRHFFCNAVVFISGTRAHSSITGIVCIIHALYKFQRKRPERSVCMKKHRHSIRCNPAFIQYKFLFRPWHGSFWRKLQVRGYGYYDILIRLIVNGIFDCHKVFSLFHCNFLRDLGPSCMISPFRIIFKPESGQTAVPFFAAFFIFIFLAG